MLAILLALLCGSGCHPTVEAQPKDESCLERWNVEGHSDNKENIAQNELFAELNRGSALRNAPTQNLGRLSALGLKHFAETPRTLVAYLIEAQIIETFAHIESKLCLFEESRDGDVYTARVRGTHIYFTNQRNEDPLAFAVRVNLKDGGILLEHEDG